MFPQYLGGVADKKFPEQAISFPRASIPSAWLQYAEQGALRLQTIGNKKYRLWKPYYFLMQWMNENTTAFEFKDVNELNAEIVAGSSAPQKRKGYCFQRAGTDQV